MLAPRDLDRLLDECIDINFRLSSGARRTLRHFLRLRERHGDQTTRYLSADDVELLEDWAAAACAVQEHREMVPAARAQETMDHGIRDRGALTPRSRRLKKTKTEGTAHTA